MSGDSSGRGRRRPRYMHTTSSKFYDPVRSLVEAGFDDAFHEAMAMINRGRRRGLSIGERDVFLSHFRGIDGEERPIPGVYVAPKTKLLKGLKELGVVTETVFRPEQFTSKIADQTRGYDPIRSDKNFAWMKYRELINPTHGERSAWETADGDMEIPFSDVYDLPTSLFLFLLDFLRKKTKNGESYHFAFSITSDLSDDDVVSAERIIAGDVSRGSMDTIKLSEIVDIYNHVIGRLHSCLNGYSHDADRATWNGSDESGTRIIIALHDGKRITLTLRFYLMRGTSVVVGSRWTDEIKEILDEVFPSRCYLTVTNREDEECLLYCIVLGMMCFESRPWMNSCEKQMEAWTIRSRGMYYSNLPTVNKISKEILEGGPVKEAVDVLRSENYSVQEFREKAAELEKMLFPDDADDVKGMGLDFYVMEYGVAKHVFPVFMSKRCQGEEGKHIKLLCVKTRDGMNGHYILVTDMDEIMKRSGGKIFFNCSKCNSSFYTRGALKGHICTGDLSTRDGMSWSRFNLRDGQMPAVGFCEKCMLKFATEFEAEYHKEHCLMKGKTGFRYVQCISSEDCHGGVPSLKGIEVDVEAEEEKNDMVKMYFADFESYINPETGEHTTMSYGVYNEDKEQFFIGYDLASFMEYLHDEAVEHEEIRVYFHNAMNYDANFILRFVLSTSWTKGWTIKAIMKSTNRLQTLNFIFRTPEGKKCTIKIGDTFLFLTMSLEGIVSSLRKPDMEQNKDVFPRFFKSFLEYYPGVEDTDVDKILRKNIFPYKFFTDASKLDTPIDEFLKIFLPLDENLKYFSETVTKESLEAQYHDVEYIMGIFGCKTARDYHDIYLRCDVLQIADVFMKTIHTLWESHHVFLPNFVGMPAASWGAFLRFDPTLDIPLYTNTIFAEFFRSMTRGGVTSAPLRHATADATHSIIYLDVNGLYPYVMQGYKYPCGFLKWETFGHLEDDLDCNKYLMETIFPALERNGEGICLTVDLLYPTQLKIDTADYPFAPEHRLIHDEFFDEDGELIGFLEQWSAANDHEKMKPFLGLVGTVYDKEKYTVHWQLLKWYIEHGMVVKKIYWGVRFEEGDYLAGYIRLNIEKRNARKDPLGKMAYKFLGNSTYGKTYEDPMKRCECMIVTDDEQLRGMLEEKTVQSITPIDNFGTVVKLDGSKIVLNKPSYIGAIVCDYSKLHMYILLYDKLKRIFPRVQLVYTDTDSFIVRVQHPEELSDSAKLFAYIREKEPGLLGDIGGQIKSETGEDDTIQEIIALRSKVYAYVTKGGHIGKRAKGVTHAAQDTQLDWETYKEALMTLRTVPSSNLVFVRSQFGVSTKEMVKKALTANDSKRLIHPDGIHTFPWGYPLDITSLTFDDD